MNDATFSKATTDQPAPSFLGERGVCCPLCNATTKFAFSHDGFQIQQCERCEHRFCHNATSENHVQTIYDDRYFTGGGAGYDDYVAENEMLVQSGRRYANLISKHRSPGNVIDVGAAAGFILQGFIDAGWQGQGIEPNERMAGLGRENGLEVLTGSWESFLPGNQQFDLVSMIQVISHFIDPAKAIDVAKKALAPKGMVLIETWDRQSWTARAFGKRWHEYSPPSVLHWFTRKNMDDFMQDRGFQKIDQGRPTKWIKLGHAASLIRYKMSDSPIGKIAASPLALCPKSIKLPYFFDDVFWALYQKTT